MGNILTYGGILTKVKAMTGKMITDAEYEKIVQLESVSEYISFLKSKSSYANVLSQVNETTVHRGQIEEIIGNCLYSDFMKLDTFATPEQRKHLYIIFFRYEVDILKRCLEYVASNKHTYDLSVFKDFFDKHSKLDLAKLLQSQTTQEFIEHLKGSQYYTVLSTLENANTSISLHDYENQLDVYYYTKVWKLISKTYKGKEQKGLLKVYGTQIDILNILWIFRSKKFYNIIPEKILIGVIPVHYRLKKQQLLSLVNTANLEEFDTFLQSTVYRYLYDEHQQCNNAEAVFFHAMNHIFKRVTASLPNSIVNVQYYFYRKEQELDRITTALECIRYQLEPTDALRYIYSA